MKILNLKYQCVVVMLLTVLKANATATAESKIVSAPPPAPVSAYDPKLFYGEPVYDAAHKLQHVVENKSQTHSKENYVMVHVKNIKKDAKARDTGRIRVAVWNQKDSYAKEGVKPFRANSHWAKDLVGDEMIFKIGGLTIGESLSFFAHFDENNSGKITRNFLGIPNEQFGFTNAKNQGVGPSLQRQGLSAPNFENTLVKFVKPGQVIELIFK